MRRNSPLEAMLQDLWIEQLGCGRNLLVSRGTRPIADLASGPYPLRLLRTSFY
jgi:hypothetical protein